MDKIDEHLISSEILPQSTLGFIKDQTIKKNKTTNLCLKAEEVGIEANTMDKEIHMTLQQKYNQLTTACKPN